MKAAGADRYLLRHETADREHYQKLHPPELSFDNRMGCLKDLKDLGFQTGLRGSWWAPPTRPRRPWGKT